MRQRSSEVFSFVRIGLSVAQLRPSITLFFLALVCLVGCASQTLAQQTNPVDRKVTNPITDTPNVNPLTQDQPIRTALPGTKGEPGVSTQDLRVDAGKATEIGKDKGSRVVVYEGNVDARVGTYRLQADKVTLYEATDTVIAEGNVVFDQGDQQRITGSRAEWNYRTKTGFFVDSTGFTNRTQDGTRLYFTADRIERVSLDTIIGENVDITACEEEVPKWSFHAKRVKIKTGDRARIISPVFRVKKIPILYTPYASISLKRQDRSSGLLTPTFGG